MSVLSPFSHVGLFVIPWTVACQALLSMGFPRQEFWSGLPCPPPGDLPDPGIEPASPALQADSLPLSHQGSPFIQVNPGLITVQGTKISHQDCSLFSLQDQTCMKSYFLGTQRLVTVFDLCFSFLKQECLCS